MTEIIDFRRCYVIDGGFSSTAIAIGGPNVENAFKAHPIWTSALVRSHPDVIKQVHKEFILAGADIVSTATYQATMPPPAILTGSESRGGAPRNESELRKILGEAVDLAQQARDETESDRKPNNRVLIAGSVGPLGAALLNGAEYDGRYLDSVSSQELCEWHRPKVTALVESGCDLIAFETFPSVIEAQVCAALMRKHFPQTPYWLSFSLNRAGDATAHGESFDQVVDTLLRSADADNTCCSSSTSPSYRIPDSLIAIGVNCAMPRAACNAVRLMHASLSRFSEPVASLALIAYPNAGFNWDNEIKRWQRDPEEPMIVDCIEHFLQSGVRFIGGCCTTTHIDIQSMRSRLDNRN